MLKIWDKFKANFKINKKVFIFLCVIFIIGVIASSLFVTILTIEDKKIVTDEITNFITNIEDINYITSMKNIFISNISFILLAWLLGISIIGIPISLIMLFGKSFILGFTVGSFILTYKLKGVLLSFIYVFPCQIINMFILIYMFTYILILSFKILESVTKKKSFDFKLVMNKYKKVLFTSLIIIVLSNLYEIFIMPSLIKLVLPLIK